ncbi:Tigger transposable element-derived protein 4 [Araneus ventricosus]|uniref:Tigger transposable element-derived protein 4 n=1 Tax=Araneus ventricosus TaxID=182803 RepID=A0A4Y2ARN5_ARAVE|nr:Tigger transposable element-derived protein 4 [Araneus ventricosus]
MASKRKNLSFAEKNELIEKFQNSNLSKVAFSKANSIPRTTFNNILAAKLCSSNAQICDQERKRQRLSPYENVDKAVLSWIKYARSQNAPISWNVFKEKSLEFANELGESSFVASNGWLQRFNSRHNLSFKKLCGEAADFDSSSLKEWKDVVLRDILERYESANVFNVDECGLFYRILPDRTLCFNGEKCVGGKKSKERLTVLLAANMDVSEKIIPLVIGKFLKPRCMKNCKSLPLFYDANSKAWMTADIWEKTLRRWDLNFSKQKRKVALIADNCTAHCTVDGLKSIELVFLPPNSTCVLQPLDQGIIQNFKATYRKLLLQDMISAIDRKEQLQVSVLNVIFYIDQSWNMVSQKTIANCFRHAGFHSSPESEELLEDDDEDLPLTELAEKLRNRGYAIPDENLYTKIDEDLATNSEASIQDIVSNVINSNAEGSDDEDDSECEKKSVSTSDALKAIDDLRCFFTNSEAADEHLKAIRDLEKVELTTKKIRQSCISQYFK